MKKIMLFAAAFMLFACDPVEQPSKENPDDNQTEQPVEPENPEGPEEPEEPEQPEEPEMKITPILDVVFNADGTATDVSETGMAITTVKGASLMTYYNDYSKGYVARFNNKVGESATSGYYRAEYVSKRNFKSALQDGHSMEVVFMLDGELPNAREVKMFSSHQSGGTGFLITNGSKNQEITFLPHVGGNYIWAQSGIRPERGRYYHVVGVWDKAAGKARIYVDGVMKKEVSAVGDLKMVADKYMWFGIGADAGDKGDTAWKGDVVLARVYDEALTDEQVTELKTRADYGFPVSDIVLDDVLYLSGCSFAPGSDFKILGRGFKDGDKIVWESTNGYRSLVSGKVSEKAIDIKLPSDLANGNFKLLLERNGSIVPLGTVDITISSTPTELRVPKIVAHRCYHTAGAPENSLAAFIATQKLGGVYGAEIDIYITTDDVPMVHHDGVIGGKRIENMTYAEASACKLSNGESLPTLASILEQAKADPSLKVIIEIKDHNAVTREQAAVDKAMEMVAEYGLKDQVEYIAFDYQLCKRIVANDSKAVVGYLNGDKAPAAVFADGIMSIDYTLATLNSNTAWIRDAHDKGMIVNTWTINSDADMIKSIVLGVDYITTDYPDRLKEVSELVK